MTDSEISKMICDAVVESITPLVQKMLVMSDRIEELEKAVTALSALKVADNSSDE